MKTKEHFASPEDKEKAVLHYFEEDTTRPPFNYEVRPARFERADETRSFHMESLVFQCLEIENDNFPEFPEYLGLGVTHPLVLSYQHLISGYREFKSTIDDINILKISMLGQKTMARDILMRRMLKNHYTAKKFYLDALIGYLSIFRRTRGTEDTERTKAFELYHQAQTIYIAHQTYTGVRSCTHMHSPLREDGDTTMKHVYEVSIATMNFFIEKLEKEKNPTKRAALYKRMKENVAVALMHDLKEDHRHMTLDNLYGKVSSLCEPDIKIGGLMSDPRLEGGTYKQRLNFFEGSRKGSIKKKMKALIKPKDKNRQKGYLTRQILDGSLRSLIEKLDTIIIKIYDRGSNIQSVKYMKAKKGETKEKRQNRKIRETQEIFEISGKIHLLTDDKDIITEVIHLCNYCLAESERLEIEYGDEIKKQQLSTVVRETREVIHAELLEATKKAA